MGFNKNFKGGARDYGRPRDDRGSSFKKPWDKKEFMRSDKPRGGFGGDRGPVEMFSATCSNCHKACEVPFRPNGTKPVYCKDCFGTMKGADEPKRFGAGQDRGPREDRGGFGSRSDSRSDRPSFSAPRADAGSNNAGLQAQVDKLNTKVDALAKSLDYAIQLLKGTAPAAHVAAKAATASAASVVVSAPAVPAAVKADKKADKKPVASKEARLAKKAAPKKVAKAGKAKK